MQYTALGMRPTVFDDVVHVKFGAQQQSTSMSSMDAFDVFFFAYGVFICWGVGENDIVAAVRRELQNFEVDMNVPCLQCVERLAVISGEGSRRG